MSAHMRPERFVRVWTESKSVTEASRRLQKAGFPLMEPGFTMATAFVLKAVFGIPLKDMPRSDLPAFNAEAFEQEVAAGPVEKPVVKALVAPTAPAEDLAALQDGRVVAWSRNTPAYAGFWAENLWPFRPGSND